MRKKPPLGVVVLLWGIVALCLGGVFGKCTDAIEYNVTFKYGWGTSVDQAFPNEDADVFTGFSPLLCATHSKDYVMWGNDILASHAIEMYVVNNSHEELVAELKERQGAEIQTVLHYDITNPEVSEFEAFGATGTANLNRLRVDGKRNFTLISCIAKIVPSPGWFVGLSSEELCIDNKFNRTRFVELQGWNSGFYEGVEYDKLSNRNDPPETVRLLLNLADRYGDANVSSNEAPWVPPPDSGSACFAAGQPVTLASGREIAVQDVTTRHVVKSKDWSTSSDVFMFSHRDAYAISYFVQLHFTDGEQSRILKVSPGHLIYRYRQGAFSDKEEDVELVEARHMQRGENLVGADGKPRRIDQVSWALGRGLYNPHTVDGDLIVSGVRVSCYTSAVDPRLASAMLMPMRVLHALGLGVVPDLVSDYMLEGRWNDWARRMLLPGR